MTEAEIQRRRRANKITARVAVVVFFAASAAAAAFLQHKPVKPVEQPQVHGAVWELSAHEAATALSAHEAATALSSQAQAISDAKLARPEAFQAVAIMVGCGHKYSEDKAADIFENNFKGRRIVATGEVARVSGSDVADRSRCDPEADDVSIKMTDA
jgi:hypothetical protein